MTRHVRVLTTGLSLLAAGCAGPRDPPQNARAASPTASAVASVNASRGDVDSTFNKGEATYSRGQYDSARVLFSTVLTRARGANDSVMEARALTYLGLAAWRQGDYARARTIGEAALAFKLRRGLSAHLFQSYNALGLLARDESRLADALELYEKGTQAARAGGDSSGLARTANNTALVYMDQARFAEARAGFIQARDAFHRLGDPREGRVLSNLGMMAIQLGDPQSAIPLLQQARALYRSTGDRTGEQNTLGQLGTAYDALGEPRLAFASFDSALALSRAQGLKQEEASDLDLIAGLHRQGGDLPRALALYEQANAINAELGSTAAYANNLRQVASIQATLGRLDLARENALAALNSHGKIGARLEELRDRLFLAELAERSAESPAAVEAHLRAAEGLSRVLDARVARVEVALSRASIADRDGDARNVLRVLGMARKDLALGGFGAQWQAASLRARAYARLSMLDSAVAAGREAVASVERVRGNFGSAFLRSSFAADKAEPYEDLVDILLRLQRSAEAFEVADGARSHALLERLAATSGNQATSHATLRSLTEGETVLRQIDSLVSRLDVLEEMPTAERNETAREQMRETTAELLKARGSYETLLAQTADRDAGGAALLGGRTIGTAEVQRILGADEALLEYLVTPKRLLVFVVTRDDVRSLTTNIARDDLARRVRLARDLLGEPRSLADAEHEVLTALHGVLMAPIERAGLLTGVRRLVVVPHSVLAYLPFAALKREGSGRYLVQDYALLHVPSAASLAVLRGQPVASALTEQQPGSVFAPFPKALPGSLREIKAFGRAVRGAQTVTSARATEARLREALRTDGIVHVATHGVMNQGNPMFSHIELVRGSGGPSDDGRLEVHELLALPIGARLVFLSGCETGVGAAWSTQFASGEDYATLAQAFLYAGARNVTATLWQIADDGAAALAERFYVNLVAMGPAEALVAAQRELLNGSRYADPYYWAGYQLIGESQGSGWISHNPPERSVQQ